MNTKRLSAVIELSHRQEKALREMQGGDGACICGRLFTPMSPKFVLCNAVTRHPIDPNLRACLIMSAFCYACFQVLNGTMGTLRGSAKEAKP